MDGGGGRGAKIADSVLGWGIGVVFEKKCLEGGGVGVGVGKSGLENMEFRNYGGGNRSLTGSTQNVKRFCKPEHPNIEIEKRFSLAFSRYGRISV